MIIIRVHSNIHAISKSLNRSYGAIKKLIDKAKAQNTFDDLNRRKGWYKRGSSSLNDRQQALLRGWLSEDSVISDKDAWCRLNSLNNLPPASYGAVYAIY